MRGPVTVRIYVLVTSVLILVTSVLILLLKMKCFLWKKPPVGVVDSHRLYVKMMNQNVIFGCALAVIVESTAIKSLQVSAKVVRIYGD